MKKLILLFTVLIIQNSLQAQQPYFPPISGGTWEMVSPESLGWCVDNIDSLYDFLDRNNTKAFMVLKDGKIVIEKYFDNFTKDSNWYWASSAKALTAVLVGIAEQQGLLKLTDSSSTFLGSGWTSCTPEQEKNITLWHQLTMTTGLEDNIQPDNHCTFDTCLIYKANPGTRWAYHNAPYTLLEKVVSEASQQSINSFTTTQIRTKIGMNGAWIPFGFNNLFYSNLRSYARFGLLAQRHFVWNNDSIIKDTVYANQMVNTSQQLNKSYGYLWWLNGKESYMVPTSQIVFPGFFAPNAPADMFAGIGKNGQIVSVSRSHGLVVLRMGEAPGTDVEVPTQFCDAIWKNLNAVMCLRTSITENNQSNIEVNIYPNPANNELNIELTNGIIPDNITVCDMLGKTLITTPHTQNIAIHNLNSGCYIVHVSVGDYTKKVKLIKQ
jgi:CubicO group peptidase (beta-lactamase class C family)